MGSKKRHISGPQPTAAASASSPRHWGVSPTLAALLVVLIILLATIDDRHVGRTADERQVIWAAVGLATTGQLTQARGHDFAFVNPSGESVSRYGIGMTLLELPAVWLAPGVERAMGPGASQPLFLVVPLLLVLVAAWFAGLAARALGGGPWASAAAVLLTGLGSPFGTYAAMAFSEPLQGLTLCGAFLCALRSARASDRLAASRWALAAGLFAGLSLLAKSLLVVVAPFALLPLLASDLPRSRTRRLVLAAAAAVPGVAVWAVFEWIRFGAFFASYPGEGFTHSFLDGTWRLLVGPNTGLLLFFPALLLVSWRTVRRLRGREWRGALEDGGALVPFILLLVLSAGWWAWHGVWGWGPRLLVPAIPLLAAVAAVALEPWKPRWAMAALAVSILINIPGFLQHPVPVLNYESNLTWPAVTKDEAETVAGYARVSEPDGTQRIAPDHVLARVPSASPFIVFPWFRLHTSGEDLRDAAKALEVPPWSDARPDLVPAVRPIPADWLATVIGPPRARFWGRGFWPSEADAHYAAVYDEGLADQVIKLQQHGERDAALALGLKLAGLAPFGSNDALVLESYRLLGNRASAVTYLQSLSPSRRAAADINVVLALFERDAGNEVVARQLLESVADRYAAGGPLRDALSHPLSEWPTDLVSMTQGRVKGAGEK